MSRFCCLQQLTKVLGQFHDPQKAADDLQTFAKMNEQRLYKLLKTCMDPQTDLKGLVKASVRWCSCNKLLRILSKVDRTNSSAARSNPLLHL